MERRKSLGYRVDAAVASDDNSSSNLLLVRLVKICGILATFLLVVYLLIFVTLKTALNKVGGDRNYASLGNPQKLTIERTIPAIQQWYHDLKDTDDLLLVENRQWQEPGDTTATCINQFMDRVKSIVPNTSPGLVRLVLHGMGLSKSPVVHKHLKSLTESEIELSAVYSRSSSCLQSNPAIARIACGMKAKIASVDPDFLEYVVNEAVVLEVLTEAMHGDPALVSEVTRALLSQEDTLKSHLGLKASSQEKREFMRNRYDRVVDAMKESLGEDVDTTASGDGNGPASIHHLQTNILEAVKVDIVNGHDANARVGLALAANVDLGELGEDWVNAYMSWDLAVVMSLDQFRVMPGKLLFPSGSSSSCGVGHKSVEDIFRRQALLQAPSLLTAGNIERLDSNNTNDGSVDSAKIANIKRANEFILRMGKEDASGRELGVSSAGEANLQTVVLASPSSRQVESMLGHLCGSSCGGSPTAVRWFLSPTSPGDRIDDNDYPIYIALVVWLTVLITGVGLEFTVLMQLLQSGWNQKLQWRYKMAQFVFPLLACISLGLASHQNYLSLLFLVVGIFKFGFPEALLYSYSAFYGSSCCHGIWERVGDFLESIATILHHSSGSLVICLLLAGVLEPDRFVMDPILVMIMQHWFVMLKYLHKPSYIVIELVLEIWFEWSIISKMETYVDKYPSIVPTAALGMLVAHWINLLAACIKLFTGSSITKEEDMDHASAGSDDDEEGSIILPLDISAVPAKPKQRQMTTTFLDLSSTTRLGDSSVFGDYSSTSRIAESGSIFLDNSSASRRAEVSLDV